MQVSDDWFDFLNKLDRVLPPFQQQLALVFDQNADTGVGL